MFGEEELSRRYAQQKQVKVPGSGGASQVVGGRGKRGLSNPVRNNFGINCATIYNIC